MIHADLSVAYEKYQNLITGTQKCEEQSQQII